MLRPSPNHGTQRLPNDDDDDESKNISSSEFPPFPFDLMFFLQFYSKLQWKNYCFVLIHCKI